MTAHVTLLSDFGLGDGYVGAMKGSILRWAANARLVDLTHAIPFGNVAAGSYAWAQAAPWFPEGTVHLGVVDPGVGGQRRAVALAVAGQRYVAPDNGLVSHVLRERELEWAFAIEAAPFATETASATFHGRDVFGPVAGYLAAGGAETALGPRLERADLRLIEADAPQQLPREAAEVDSLPAELHRCTTLADHVWATPIAYVDGFGNAITELPLPAETRAGVACVKRRWVRFARTYSEVEPGELLALRGSLGTLEIAQNLGSAAHTLGLLPGDMVKWLAVERR